MRIEKGRGEDVSFFRCEWIIGSDGFVALVFFLIGFWKRRI